MSASLLNEISKTNTELYNLVDAFDQDELNAVPYQDSWTAGQVVNHLYKSDSFLQHLFTAPTVETKRPPDENVGQLREVFLNFEKKLQSPDMIIPDDKTFDKQEALQSLKDTRSEILDSAGNTDLTGTTTIESPLGDATLLEVLYFHLYHTKRHINQLQKIRTAVGSVS